MNKIYQQVTNQIIERLESVNISDYKQSWFNIHGTAKNVVTGHTYKGIKQFINSEEYYSVLVHESVHSTGNKNRLNRQYNISIEDEYAKEELVAELGSAFFCAEMNLKAVSLESHAIYIKSWLTALKNDCKLIFKASSQAQKAVDYILNKQQKDKITDNFSDYNL